LSTEGPLTLLKLNHGLSSFGGFFACVILSIWFFRSEGKRINKENRKRHEQRQSLLAPMKPWAYADGALKGFVPGYFLGRMGCFSVKDHPGQVTDFVLGVKGMCTWDWDKVNGRPGGRPACADDVLSLDNQTRFSQLIGDVSAGITDFELFRLINPETALHDLGLYEALWFLLLTPLFFYLDRKPRFPGFFAALLMFTHMPMRVFLDSLRRQDGIDRFYFSSDTFQGLTPAQIGAMGFIGVGVWIVATRRHIEPVKITMQRLREEEAANGIVPDEVPVSEAVTKEPSS
jgi:prolipoprotein diacylglyceryltransferase